MTPPPPWVGAGLDQWELHLLVLEKDYDDKEDIFENVLDEGVDILEKVADEHVDISAKVFNEV